MPISRSPTAQVTWISRRAESDFADLIKRKQAFVVPLIGAGGAGKTSLLHRFTTHCRNVELPVLSLDLTKLQTASALDALMQATTYGTEGFDSCRKRLQESYEAMSAILQSYGAHAGQAADLLQKTAGKDESFGTIVDAAVGTVKAAHTFWQRAENKRHRELLRTPEESLLRALAEDFAKGGALLIDTMEQAAQLNLQTRLHSRDDGELVTVLNEQARPIVFLEYLERLAFFLFDKPVLMVLAGRPPALRELGGLPQKYFAPIMEAPPFTEAEIDDYVRRQLPQLQPPSGGDIHRLHEITRGNPFLLERVTRLMAEWEPVWRWDAAQWQPLVESYRHDNRHGLLLFVTQRLLTHVLPDDTAFWRLALPRQSVHQDMAALLFPTEEFPACAGENRLSVYESKGLIYRGTQVEYAHYFLHDETREALQAWAEHKRVWLDDRASALHAILGGWFASAAGWPENYSEHDARTAENGNSLLMDAAYHLVMANADFEFKHRRLRVDFWQQLAGSLSLTNANKMDVASALPTLSTHQIHSLDDVFSDEIAQFRKLLSASAQSWLRSHGNYGTLPPDWASNPEFLQHALQLFPAEAELARLLAELIAPKDLGKAEALLRNVVEVEPDNALGHLFYANFLHSASDKRGEAESHYLKALSIAPGSSLILVDYAQFLQQDRNSHDTAESMFERAISADPDHAEILGRYAIFLAYFRQEYDKAESMFKRANAVGSDHAEAIGNYAIFLYNVRKNAGDAEVMFERAVKAKPSADILDSYLQFLHLVQQHDKAELVFKQAVAAYPSHPLILGRFALFLQTAKNNYDESEHYFVRALEADPGHAFFTACYAIFQHTIRRDHASAEGTYRRALELNPQDANCLGNLAQIVLARGEREEGRTLVDRAFAVDPSPPLQLELWFYRFAHCPQDYPEAGDAIEALLAESVCSPGWDLSITLAQAGRDGHPNLTRLESLATRLAAEPPTTDAAPSEVS